jgi:hypothetical protein
VEQVLSQNDYQNLSGTTVVIKKNGAQKSTRNWAAVMVSFFD